MSELPTDVVQQALDAAGCDVVLGDLQEGTKEAQVCLRAYRNCRQQLLRAAHWDFARRQSPLVLIADASGQTPNVGTLVPAPWQYSYQYPIDCVKLRYVPFNQQGLTPPIPAGNIIPPNNQAPLTTGAASMVPGARMRPSRFLITSDVNYPPAPGMNIAAVQGVSPAGRTVILSNVQYALAVYTVDMLYPSVWDPMFRAALVSYIASEVVLPLDKSKNKQFGMAMQPRLIAVFKQKLMEARVANGNETWSNSDISVDWMRVRTALGGRGRFGSGDYGDGGGLGTFGGGYDSCGAWDTGNTSVY